MKQRLIIGLSAGSLFIVLLLLGAWWYTGFLFLLAQLAYYEFCRMSNFKKSEWPVIIGMFTITLAFISGLTEQHVITKNYLLHYSENMLLGLVLFLIFIVLNKNKINIDDVGYLFIGSIYIGYGFSYMMQVIWHEGGLALSFLVLFITWASDSGAYIVGRRWGETKLCPEVSPGKTVEGSIFGVISGMFASILIFCFFPKLSTILGYNSLLLGLFISVSGQMGDLVESAIKRAAHVKDSGIILPGHGGVFDRFDSLIFTFIMLHLVGLI